MMSETAAVVPRFVQSAGGDLFCNLEKQRIKPLKFSSFIPVDFYLLCPLVNNDDLKVHGGCGEDIGRWSERGFWL